MQAEGTAAAIELRALDRTSLDAIASVHRAAFPHSVLTMLGHQAVCRYYAWQLDRPRDAYAIGAYRANELTGFCFGGIFPEAIGAFVRRNAVFFLSRAIAHPELIAHPLVRRRVKRALAAATNVRARRRKRRRVAPPAPSAWPFDILSIAVHPVYQGAGIGALLMQRAEALAREGGFFAMTLVVNAENAGALRFYERLGWERALVDGAWSGNMIRWLSPRR